MWWRWRKVTYANLTPELRKKFETYGEDVIAQAVANPDIGMGPGDLPALIRSNYSLALDWLGERRDLHERREDRLETLELAILVFVVLGVIVESGLGKVISHFF
jgi:hypothetical protein